MTKYSLSCQLFNDAIKLAVTYKQNSGDFMDEVMQELEVRKEGKECREWSLRC